ncbi:NF-kappa-B inhibitor cactus [Lingula anatina]|uniref:NF-kappa-B inhibitor cactus n=1 Tax=Lingula anatina TaxID=7574 RepID=A0A1S3IMZ5_LINAN|nr:NF-kappa-B inhibitor cactus [Lingula anatina]|eukprot:XP_013399271.1 NF-kappa-B inhibitor cactus [Lingula anatina]
MSDLPCDVETDCAYDAPFNRVGSREDEIDLSKLDYSRLQPPPYLLGKPETDTSSGTRFDSGFGSIGSFNSSTSDSLTDGIDRLKLESQPISESCEQDRGSERKSDSDRIDSDQGFTEDNDTPFAPANGQLTQQQIDLYSQDEDGDTQLHVALIQMVEYVALQIIDLAPYFKWVNIQNNLGQAPLHLAAITKQPVVIRRLMCAGASVEQRDRHGNTALHIACREGHIEGVRMLTTPVTHREVSQNTYQVPYQKIPQDLNARNYNGMSCLHLAAERGHVGVVDYLVKLGADVNIEDGKSGRNILHHAVENHNVELIYYLLQHTDINLEAKTFDFKSALGLAMGRKFTDIATALVNAGADFAQWTDIFSDPSDEGSDEDLIDDLMIGGQPVH